MDLYDRYRVDAEKQWVEWGDTGASFLLAFASGHHNQKFKNAMERKLRRYRNEIRMDVLPDDVNAQASYEVFAEAIVLDWKGVRGPSVPNPATGGLEPGPEIPYSREACIKLFQDIPELFDEIRAVAMERSTFQEGTLRSDAKN